MTPEQVFRYSRTYKLYYSDKYDFVKYKGGFPMPPLINQPERRYYYRFAQKLADDQIHALFTLGYFFNPNAFISDFASPDAEKAAIAFAARWENGPPKLEADLYDLKKRLADVDLDEWLYGERVGGSKRGGRALMPPVLQEIINGELALDIGCLLLLIPQESLSFNWPLYMNARNAIFESLGPSEWVKRLKFADRLLWMQRHGWRNLSHMLSEGFWRSLNVPSLAPQDVKLPASLDI